jgi:hypothetical protein
VGQSQDLSVPADAALAEPGGGMADAVAGPGRVLPPRRVVGELAALVTRGPIGSRHLP